VTGLIVDIERLNMAEEIQIADVDSQNQVPEVTATEKPERMFRQADVNKFVGLAKKEGRDKGYAEALQESQRNQYSEPSSMGGMQQYSIDQLRQIASEEAGKKHQEYMNQAEQHRREALGQQIANDFNSKLSSGKDRYSDFDEKVAPLLEDLHNMPHLVLLANGMDNTADVMYDLATNPHKVANLLTLADKSTRLAQLQMQQLSNSIKTNQAASKQPSSREPLSQIKPSTVGIDNGSPKSVKDFKKMSWLRG
jgi:hypothetical protein